MAPGMSPLAAVDLHVVIPEFAPEGWRWIEPVNADRGWNWHFYRVGREACRRAVRASRKAKHSILLSHGPNDARECAKLRAIAGYNRPFYVPFSFHAPYMRGFREKFIYRRLAPFMDLIVVHSEHERLTYADELDVPLSRIEVVPWYYEDAEVEEPAKIEKPYICAVGASMRDYATLFRAMQKLPDIRLVVIVRPENLEGLEVPSNVTVLENTPKQDLWNIQYHSRMHVLPLNASARSGHACLTQAMYFGRPNVVADVPCMSDYVQQDVTAKTYRPEDADHLAKLIRDLWDDDDACGALGEAARAHALKHFSQRSMGDYLESIVIRYVLADA